MRYQRLVVPARDRCEWNHFEQEEYKPRESARIRFCADAEGAPWSGAEVSLGVSDEAIQRRPDFPAT